MENKLNIYVLYDKVSGETSQPMLLKDDRCVKSTYIKFLAENDNSLLSIYCTDYDIYKIGVIDLENQKVTEDKLQICNLSALKVKEGE